MLLAKAIYLKRYVWYVDGHLRGEKSGNDAGMRLRAVRKVAMPREEVVREMMAMETRDREIEQSME